MLVGSLSGTALLLAVVLMDLPTIIAVVPGTQQATLRVEAWSARAAATVETLLGDLEGVASVRADRSSETAVVVYDPAGGHRRVAGLAMKPVSWTRTPIRRPTSAGRDGRRLSVVRPAR